MIFLIGVMLLIGSLCFMILFDLIYPHGALSHKDVLIGPLILTFIKLGILLVKYQLICP